MKKNTVSVAGVEMGTVEHFAGTGGMGMKAATRCMQLCGLVLKLYCWRLSLVGAAYRARIVAECIAVGTKRLLNTAEAISRREAGVALCSPSVRPFSGFSIYSAGPPLTFPVVRRDDWAGSPFTWLPVSLDCMRILHVNDEQCPCHRRRR